MFRTFISAAIFACQLSTTQATECGPHLTSPNDIWTFPTFPEGTNSLLSQILTEEIWDELKDKEDEFGFTLREAIFSGCVNLDSGVGVYAGSPDTYRTFAPLFDPLIQKYHGRKKESIHYSNMDYTKLKISNFMEDEEDMIISTRIRVARNLDGYPLGAKMTRE